MISTKWRQGMRTFRSGRFGPREFDEGRSNTAAVGWCRPARWGCVLDLATQKVGFPTAECRGHCPVGSHDR